MAVDKNKIIAEATKLVQKGALDKAISTYQKILAVDPKDVRVLLKVGELHQKKGDDKAAADAFTRVAETYAEQGFFLKSVAVYKQIVKLDPEGLRVNERLAGLYQQLGLMSDAMSQLQHMAAAHEKAGDGAKLTDVLKRMIEIDPDNIASSIKLGELHARANEPEHALECFQRAAGYLKKHSRADEYLRVAERISALQPHDLGLTRELAHIYLAKGDTKRALAKLQLCFKADPKEVETLQLLAQAFRDLGQTSKTISVYKELAHVHQERGRAADAKATWRKVQELAPDDEDAAGALGTPLASAPPLPRPAASAPRAPPAGAPPGAARVPPPPPPPAAGPDAVSKLLTETDVYVKYGLHDKALDHLRKVLAIDPQLPDAHERARELHLAAGRPAEAGASGVRAVRACLARGDADRAREAVARLRHIAPDHPELDELGAATGGTEEVQLEVDDVQEIVLDPDESPSAAPPDDDELAIRAAGAEGDEVVEDEVAPAVSHGGGAPELAPEAELDLDAAGDALAEAAAIASAYADEVVDEPPPPPHPPARAAPSRPAPAPVRPPAAAARPTLTPPPPLRPAAPAPSPPPTPTPARSTPAPTPTPARAAALRAPGPARPTPPPTPRAPPAPPAPRPPPAAREDADLTDDIEDADFFLQQGLLDEARDAFRSLLALHPGHRAVLDRLAEVERRAAPRAAPAPVRESVPLAPMGGDDSFDIARELAEELGPAAEPTALEDEFQYSVEDVFSQFKKGVEQTVKREDSATHYDLGIAYKEMGLIDDAVHEFETALAGNDRKREVDCLSMVGLCRMAQGDPRAAVEAFRRALASEFLGRDSAKALHFELGMAYETAGDREAALHYLQKVAKLDPAYREVAGRVAALGGGPGRPPADAARPGVRPANGVAGAARAATPAPARPATPPAGPKKNIGYL